MYYLCLGAPSQAALRLWSKEYIPRNGFVTNSNRFQLAAHSEQHAPRGTGHRRKATGRGGAGHHQKATGRGEAPRATGRYPGPYFPVFFWRSGLKSDGVWTKCRPLFDKPFIIFEAMSPKRKSGKGKAAAGTDSEVS